MPVTTLQPPLHDENNFRKRQVEDIRMLWAIGSVSSQIDGGLTAQPATIPPVRCTWKALLRGKQQADDPIRSYTVSSPLTHCHI